MLTGTCLPSASTLSYRESCVCVLDCFDVLLHCSHAGDRNIVQLETSDISFLNVRIYACVKDLTNVMSDQTLEGTKASCNTDRILHC